jgi:sugar/nucleoside kinase (ribokinase family)
VAHAAPGFARLADLPRGAAERTGTTAPARSLELPPDAVRDGAHVDPTGCGDVWGATAFARLLAGDPLEAALRAANRAAGRSAEHRGVEGLVAHLASASR